MQYDVIVVGGGPAGVGAAISAARNGAKTILLEVSNALGGMGTNGLVPFIRTAGDKGGIIHEYWKRMLEVDACVLNDTHAYVNTCLGKLVLNEMVSEAGVEIRFHSPASGVKVDDSSITGVYVADKSGSSFLKSKVVVDTTGDGDIAAWSGVPYKKGDESGRLQAVSFNFHIGGINLEILPEHEKFKILVSEAIEAGELDMPQYTLKYLSSGSTARGLPPNTHKYQFDFDFDTDASDPVSFSRGEMLCQQRTLQFWRFLKKHVPGFENASMINLASALGVRETRRITGLKTLTEDDVLTGKKYSDGICRCSWYMDLHDGQNKYPLKEYRAKRAPRSGDFYEIPYACLIPEGMNNLLVAGRCISSTRPASGAIRLQATCMNTGQAAGTAAAISINKQIPPPELNGVELRDILKQQGMEL